MSILIPELLSSSIDCSSYDARLGPPDIEESCKHCQPRFRVLQDLCCQDDAGSSKNQQVAGRTKRRLIQICYQAFVDGGSQQPLRIQNTQLRGPSKTVIPRYLWQQVLRWMISILHDLIH